jgi:hypothetical protein
MLSPYTSVSSTPQIDYGFLNGSFTLDSESYAEIIPYLLYIEISKQNPLTFIKEFQ